MKNVDSQGSFCFQKPKLMGFVFHRFFAALYGKRSDRFLCGICNQEFQEKKSTRFFANTLIGVMTCAIFYYYFSYFNRNFLNILAFILSLVGGIFILEVLHWFYARFEKIQ